jgi:F-type H+-transporting ATPase subunit a
VPEQSIDFVGHVANGEHALIHIGTFYGINMDVTKHVLMLWIAALIVFVFVMTAVRRYLRSGVATPTGSSNALEVIVEWVRDSIARPNVGNKWLTRWTPMFITLFLFILVCNGLGLIPIFEVIGLVDHMFIHSGHDSFIAHLVHGGSTATANFNVTAALASLTFVNIIIAGTLQHGFIKHWMNLVPHGMPWPLYILLIPLETISLFVRPFALTMRLAANMTGGHIAILAILSFVFTFAAMFGPIAGLGVGFAFSWPLSTALLGLEIIIVIVQAYVFTLLTAVFIGMAIHAHH